jgi:hypothetical protein
MVITSTEINSRGRKNYLPQDSLKLLQMEFCSIQVVIFNNLRSGQNGRGRALMTLCEVLSCPGNIRLIYTCLCSGANDVRHYSQLL